MSMSDCLALVAKISPQDNDSVLAALDARLSVGDDPTQAQSAAMAIVLRSLMQERNDLAKLVDGFYKPGTAKPVEQAEPPRPMEGMFTPPGEWSMEAFAGPMLSRRPESTRSVMNAVLDARNKSLKRVNPASVLESDIARAAKALELVVGEIEAGRYDQTEVPVGPMPHVLHMLGAPMQMMQMNTSIVRKVLVERHSEDFANVTPRQFVEGLYKPAMVMQAREADEYEVTTDIIAKNGNPITAVIKVNTQLMPDASGRRPKVASVKSAYARQAIGGKEPLLQRVLTGKLRYAEMERAQRAVINDWARFQPSISRGLADRKIRGELDLVKFIGDNYKAPNGDWSDAPSFSSREQTDTPAFKRWFGNSTIVWPDGQPKVMYHGTARDITVFRPKQAGAIFLTDDPAFAEGFADASANWIYENEGQGFLATEPTPEAVNHLIRKIGQYYSDPDMRDVSDMLVDEVMAWSAGTAELGGKLVDYLAEGRPQSRQLGMNIMPLYVKAERPFDYRNPAHRKKVIQHLLTGEHMVPDGSGKPTWAMEPGQPSLRTASVIDMMLSDESTAASNWTTIEDDNFQAALKELGFDSFYVQESGVRNLAVYDPAQVKSATGNSGAFDPANPDIRYSRRPQQGRFNLRNFNIGHQFVEAIQDRYNRWKQTTEDIRQQGGVVNEANDFYLAEERYWGIVGAQNEDFSEEVNQFVKDVAADKLYLEDVALYAYAQHAPERNARIASQRATMPDGGSGMMTQDALDLLDEARQAGLEPVLQKHAATLRAWIQGTRDLLFANGMIDQNEYDAWTNMFSEYVPLRGLDGAPEQRGTGQGFNIRGREGKAAMGRKSRAKQIIEQIVQDRTRALTRIGKNDVGRSFGQFVIDNPSPNLWEINAVENKPFSSVDANGNRIIEERQQIVTDDRAVTFKDGGKEVHVLVHDERLLEQLKNLNADNPSRVVGAFLFVNKILARLYTSLNPVFTAINGLRDLQAATVGVIDEIGFMAVPRLLANMPSAMVESYKAEAGRRSNDYNDFRNTGGKTGFFNFRDIDAQTAELQAMLRDAERMAIDPRKFGPMALRLIESLNSGIENGIRLASFKTARQSGRALADAARISKNITVNFNRRGTMTPTLSAYFLFFNPAVQGTTRIIQAMANPKVVATMGAAMAGVAALALRNAGMGEDDDGVAWWDKIPSEVKERNLVIVLPPGASGGDQVKGSQIGRYVKIPMPYGYNFFAVVANQAVDVWRNMADPRRGATPLDAAAKAFTAFMGAWIPVQELGRSFETPASAALAAVPDALNPLAQIAINLSSFGRPLYPDDPQSKNVPDSSKFFPGQAGSIFQQAAERMNSATGGDRYRSGLLDVTPAALETIARSYGGGPVTFTLDVVNALYLRQSIERPAVRYGALPFFKQLSGVIDAETDRMVGYQRLEQAAKIVDPMVRARREGGPEAREAMAAMREELGPMLRLADTIESTRGSLSDVRKKELKIMSSDKPEAMKYVELMAQAQKRREVLQKFNAAYDRALLQQDEAKKRKPPPAPQ